MADFRSAHSGQVFPVGEVRQYTKGYVPSREKFPFYHLIPKDREGQLRWRLYVRQRCLEEREFREAIREACRLDLLFFLNTMCIAKGTPVVTDRGLVAIDRVTAADKVWDGEEWVSQGGAIYRGNKKVISAYGIKLTSDHKVMTDVGWQQAGCGYDREAVRLPDGYREKWQLQEEPPSGLALSMRMRPRNNRWRELTTEGSDQKLRLPKTSNPLEATARASREPRVCGVAGDARSLSEGLESKFSSVWRARYQGLRSLASIRELCGGYGVSSGRDVPRANRQQRKLRARQLPVGDPQGTGQQYSPESLDRNQSRQDDPLGDVKAGWGFNGGDCLPSKSWSKPERPTESSELQEAEVYDLINCGPRQAFTVVDSNGEPLLVHNCYIFEPRPEPRELPLNTWPDQDFCLDCMQECFGVRDLGLEKSRGIGASWNIVALTMHKWLFTESDSSIGVTIGYVSRNEDAVDSSTDPDSLMWKLDFLYSWLPIWLRKSPEGVPYLNRSYSQHRFLHEGTKATTYGYAATADVGTGGRKTAMFMDEFGKFDGGKDQAALDSTQHVTQSRFFISTYGNDSNAFYRLMNDQAGTTMLKVVADWKDNPERAAGLYSVEGGVLKILDTDYEFPPDYPFELNPTKGGLIRSPWYDAECKRPGATARSIARELDRDARGASSKFFISKTIAVASKHIRPFKYQGEMEYDSEDFSPTWSPRPQGKFKWWDLPIDDRNKLGYAGPFTIGCDVAAGTAGDTSSNSAAVIIDIPRRQVVGGFYSNSILPHHFARMIVATCKFLSEGKGQENCFLVWENQGPGLSFYQELRKTDWHNFYWRHEDIKNKNSRQTKKAGWWNRSRELEALFSALQDAILSEDLIIPWDMAINELSQYEYDKTGRVIHVSSERSEDGSAKSAAHGDVAIALTLAYLGYQKKKKAMKGRIVEKEASGPVGKWLEYEKQRKLRNPLPRATEMEWWTELADVI